MTTEGFTMRRIASLLISAAATAVAAVALAGCATPSGGAPAPDPSAPSGSTEVTAAWLDDGRAIGLVTRGSSSCVPLAEDAVLEDGALVVTLVDPEGKACTRDLVPRASIVALPDGVDPADDLDIRVTGDAYDGATTLPGADGLAGPGGETDYQPSAGWTSDPGQFVLLSWGSSSCVPVATVVAATAPAEVTVTFEEPPADQVCTMDMGPRALVLQVDGLDESDGAEAVLTGSPEFADVRVPIVGVN